MSYLLYNRHKVPNRILFIMPIYIYIYIYMPLYAPLLISKGKYSSYILFGSATLFVCLFDVKVALPCFE